MLVNFHELVKSTDFTLNLSHKAMTDSGCIVVLSWFPFKNEFPSLPSQTDRLRGRSQP